jgi:hypothetical protein
MLAGRKHNSSLLARIRLGGAHKPLFGPHSARLRTPPGTQTHQEPNLALIAMRHATQADTNVIGAAW